MLKGKNIIVTGANRGIGRAIVGLFAENGANIWSCARKKDNNFEADMYNIAARYDVQVSPVYFDLENRIEIKNGVQKIIEEKKPIDVLVNNAGIIPENRMFAMMPMDSLEKVFTVNFVSATYLTQLIVRKMMRDKRGSIINITSVAAIDGYPSQLEYVSSKAAMIGATRKLALELGEYGIRVNALAPSFTETDMIKGVNPDILRDMMHLIALKRLARPEEIANAALFLASDLSSYITGQTIRVDGGLR